MAPRRCRKVACGSSGLLLGDAMTGCVAQQLRYTEISRQTTRDGICGPIVTRRTSADRRIFYVRMPLRAFNGRAMAGRRKPAGFLVRRSANPVICPPTPFCSGARVQPALGGRKMRHVFARPEQAPPIQLPRDAVTAEVAR
jgi:hypothetical protein